jgi:hypothetical protein
LTKEGAPSRAFFDVTNLMKVGIEPRGASGREATPSGVAPATARITDPLGANFSFRTDFGGPGSSVVACSQVGTAGRGTGPCYFH